MGNLARYYLRAMEQYLAKDPEPYFQPTSDLVINDEHIMPENLNDEWSHITPEVHEAYLNRLGNQALLKASVNAEIGQSGFNAKKPHLAAAGYTLTSDIAKYDKWGKDEIEDRQKTLGQVCNSNMATETKMKKIWRV